MTIHRKWLRMSGLLAGPAVVLLIVALVGGQDVPGDSTKQQTAAGSAPPFSFDVVQSEPGRDGLPVTTAHWHVTGQGADFDATLTAGSERRWIRKRGGEFLYDTGCSYYRFQADAWAKGYVHTPLWGRFDAELPGYPTDLGRGYRPVDSSVQTAAVLHVWIDLDPSGNLGGGVDPKAGTETTAGGEACRRVRFVPPPAEAADTSWQPLGLAPEVACQFAVSDGRLVALDITIRQMSAQGAAAPWVTVSTVVSQWGSMGGRRVPASIRSEIRDLQTGQQTVFTNAITFATPGEVQLAEIPAQAHAVAVDLEPRDPSVYEQRITGDSADWAARLALIRHQAFGVHDADGARQALAILAVALETAPASILTQAAELAYVLGADDVCVQCAGRVVNDWAQFSVGANDSWLKRSRIVKGRALARSQREEKGWADAVALVQSGALSFEEMDQANAGGVMWETGQPVEARMALSTSLVQSQGTALAQAVSARAYAAAYEGWRNVRLRYIREVMEQSNNEDTWKRTDQFTADGPAQGLTQFGVARELWQTRTEQAGRAHARDAWDNDDPNRECLKIWLEYLQSREPDRAKAEAEMARVQRLLDEPDPAIRAAATTNMRRILRGDKVTPRVWGASVPLTAQVVNTCSQMLQLAATEDERREAVDCALVAAWRADLDYAPPLVAGFSPSLASVLALREQLPTEADRKAMDGARAVALARRGQTEAAQQIVTDLRQWLGAAQGTDAQRDRVSSLIRDTEATQKDVAERIAKGERFEPLTDTAKPPPPPTWPDDQMRHMFKEAVIAHHLERVMITQDVREARALIEQATNASLYAVEPQSALVVVDQLIARLGPDAPAGKLAWAQVGRMDALTWIYQFNDAIGLGQRVSDQYLYSKDSLAAEAGAEALCRCYAYTALYLRDLEGGRRFLETLRAAYPDGRYEWMVKLFIGMVEKPGRVRAASRQ